MVFILFWKLNMNGMYPGAFSAPSELLRRWFNIPEQYILLKNGL